MESYFDVVSRSLELLPPHIVIHRLTGDGPKKLLIAPLWTADKHAVHNAMLRWFNEHNVIQGRMYQNSSN